MDPAATALDPSAAIVAADVEYDPGMWHATFTATPEILLYRSRTQFQGQALTWFDESGKPLQQVGKNGPFYEASLAPDGRTIASRYGDPDQNIWVIQGDGTFTRLTENPINSHPVWSPDGSRIAYSGHRGASKIGLYVKDTKGQSPERQLLGSRLGVEAASWSSDGKLLLFIGDPGDGVWQIGTYHLPSGRAETYLSVRSAPFSLLDAQFSPDGKGVAYAILENGRPEVYLASFPVPNRRRRLTTAGGAVPRWRVDGRELYFLGTDRTLFAIPITDPLHMNPADRARPLFRVSAYVPSWATSPYSVDRSGKRFLFVVSPSPVQSQFVLVTNWP